MDTSRNYPASTLSLIKGKWYVSVTIPADLRSVFNNRIQVKVSTGTSDKSEGLCCTNRVKDVLPLSPDELSLPVP
jgi:hypothetical protein